MDALNIGWPEGIWIGLVTLVLIAAAVKNGEPKEGNHSLAQTAVSVGVTFGLLYWGGFFA